ncbi:MAG: hypothetical protein ACFFDP_04900 [Promethearchaeota archaeon]
MSTNCSEPIMSMSISKRIDMSIDIRRTKRLLRQAIAASQGEHRIRLQRELAALEDYERSTRQQTQELSF